MSGQLQSDRKKRKLITQQMVLLASKRQKRKNDGPKYSCCLTMSVVLNHIKNCKAIKYTSASHCLSLRQRRSHKKDCNKFLPLERASEENKTNAHSTNVSSIDSIPNPNINQPEQFSVPQHQERVCTNIKELQ